MPDSTVASNALSYGRILAANNRIARGHIALTAAG